MKTNKKTFAYSVLYKTLCFLAALVFVTAANAAGLFFANESASLPTLLLSGLLFAALIAASFVHMLRCKRTLDVDITRREELYLAKKEEISASPAAAAAKLARLGRLCRCCYAAYTAVALGAAFFSAKSAAASIPVAVISVFVLSAVFSRIIPPFFPKNKKMQLRRRDYPEIFALARRAAAAAGCRRRFDIGMQTDCGTSVTACGRITLQLGAPLLNLLHRDELYQVLLHEFSRLSYNLLAKSCQTLFIMLDNAGSGLSSLLFCGPETEFMLEFELFRKCSSDLLEENAAVQGAPSDSADNTQNGRAAAAAALTKISFYAHFEQELCLLMPKSEFADENPPRSYLRSRLELFLKVLPSRREFWEGLDKNEIQPRNAQPILRRRIEMLGNPVLDISFPSGSDAYTAQCRRALNTCDNTVYEMLLNDYQAMRSESYLEPLKKITDWENNGCPLSHETVKGIISSLVALDRFDQAIAVCDRTLSDPALTGASAYALFIKGSILLKRYDPSGITLLYDAIEKDPECTPEALELIGTFCCQCGLEAELAHYRQVSAALLREKEELDLTQTLDASDELVPSPLPKELLDDILAYMLKAGNGRIESVCLVRKVISRDIFCDAFVLRFDRHTGQQAKEKAMNAIFEYLDTHPSALRFSLFLWDARTSAAVKSVNNSCIYDRTRSEK